MNAASANELEALPGVGPVLAERIVDMEALSMGATAENLHDRFPQLTKERADAFALGSQQKTAHAYAEGWIQPDLVPVAMRSAEQGWGLLTADEGHTLGAVDLPSAAERMFDTNTSALAISLCAAARPAGSLRSSTIDRLLRLLFTNEAEKPLRWVATSRA